MRQRLDVPVQTALVGGWTIGQRRVSGHCSLRYLLIGAAAGVFFLLPFLEGLSASTGHMKIEFVRKAAHTPVAQFLIVFWPLILLALLVPAAGRINPLVRLLAGVFIGLLVWNEIFNAYDGGYRGDFRRFNAALKWWGWIFTGGVFSISAFLLASDRRAVRVLAASILLLGVDVCARRGPASRLSPFQRQTRRDLLLCGEFQERSIAELLDRCPPGHRAREALRGTPGRYRHLWQLRAEAQCDWYPVGLPCLETKSQGTAGP